MKFYNVDQQSFVYKEAMYKRNDKFKLNLTPSIYNVHSKHQEWAWSKAKLIILLKKKN